ncbi:MAG: arsenate reductase ArsC [Alphaproteobacteria bacterium]|nr:arsenate reductase ArsC [Alphaproteobacteria bacterium]
MRVWSVLFLCTANSARSILAEAIVHRVSNGRVIGYSAGSRPRGTVHPAALRLLAALDYPLSEFRSKSWDEFAETNAPPIDLVVTVCDSAADEICPVWPGHPVSAHWGMPDPAAADVERQDEAFSETYRQLHSRIAALVDLHPDRTDLRIFAKSVQSLHDRLVGYPLT